MRTCVEVDFMDTSVPSAINDNAIVDKAENAIKKLFGADAISIMPFPSTGSEDFALFTEKLPGAIIRFGTNDPENAATMLGVHNPGVQFDDRSLFYASALFCQYVLDYLS